MLASHTADYPVRAEKFRQLEKEIIKFEDEQTQLETSLIDLASKSDSKKIQENSQRLGTVRKKVEELFDELTLITLQRDEIFKKFEDRLKELDM